MNIRFYLIFALLIWSSSVSFGMQKRDPNVNWSKWPTDELEKERISKIKEIRQMQQSSCRTLKKDLNRKAFCLRKLNKVFRERGVKIITPKKWGRKKKFNPNSRSFIPSKDIKPLVSSTCKYKSFFPLFFSSITTFCYDPIRYEDKDIKPSMIPFGPFSYTFPWEDIKPSASSSQNCKFDTSYSFFSSNF